MIIMNEKELGLRWTATRDEVLTMSRIANRAVKLAKEFGVDYDKMSALMDIEACHCNGCTLDLDRLESFPDFDFAHDVFGIYRHINRTNGKLEDCFLPRCAKRKEQNADSI